MTESADLKKCKEALSGRLESIEGVQAELRDSYSQIEIDITEIKKELAGLTELLTIFKNGKGFVKTWIVIGKILVWLAVTGGILAGAIKYLSSLGQP